MALQQLKVISANNRCEQLGIIPKTQLAISWQRETQKEKSLLHTIQRDTTCASSCTYVPQSDQGRYNKFAVSMHDLPVYLTIKTMTKLLMFSRQRRTCKLCVN